MLVVLVALSMSTLFKTTAMFNSIKLAYVVSLGISGYMLCIFR